MHWIASERSYIEGTSACLIEKCVISQAKTPKEFGDTHIRVGVPILSIASYELKTAGIRCCTTVWLIRLVRCWCANSMFLRSGTCRDLGLRLEFDNAPYFSRNATESEPADGSFRKGGERVWVG